ncbi:MAG: hypothetical protein IT518_16355 [Burkholderiales bacterium]|nr:hypothetical protein [Burkholderiales bacterium]
MAARWRRLRQYFGISAPRMAVRTRLPWWGRGALVLMLLALIGGMWWWGFDFGQILGGFNRKEVEARLASLDGEAGKLRSEVVELRARNTVLESELAMASGKQEALSRQATELAGENAQLKEELAFLQQLVTDAKTVGVAIQRVAVEPDGEDTWRYSVLVVRGGNPKDEFVGNLSLRATLGGAEPGADAPQRSMQLPEDDPEAAAALKLKFKYYQRVEGRFRVPPGARVLTLVVRAYETGYATPRAARTLSLN